MYFVIDCYVNPEQYDIYDDKRHQIGYVKLRYGELKACYPDLGGNKVYEHYFFDNLKGCFDNDEERVEFLSKIGKAIYQEYKFCCGCELDEEEQIEFQIISPQQWEYRGMLNNEKSVITHIVE